MQTFTYAFIPSNAPLLLLNAPNGGCISENADRAYSASIGRTFKHSTVGGAVPLAVNRSRDNVRGGGENSFVSFTSYHRKIAVSSSSPHDSQPKMSMFIFG